MTNTHVIKKENELQQIQATKSILVRFLTVSSGIQTLTTRTSSNWPLHCNALHCIALHYNSFPTSSIQE
jgi:hypothetical protein